MSAHAAERPLLPKIENAPWALGILLFCLARLAVLEYWLIVRLESFYFFRGDDVSRLAEAVRWVKHPTLLPMPDWLPLPCYLIGLVLKFFPHPQSAGSHLHAAFTTAALALLGFTTLRLFPKNPAASLIAVAGIQFAPEFQVLSLSASAEVEMWLFLIAAVFFWTLYLERGERRWAWFNAASLVLLSMTRYEAWLFLGLFSVLAAEAFRKRGEPGWVLRRYVAALSSYVVYFVLYQEHGLSNFRAHPEMFVLPLSYRGIRLHFGEPFSNHVDMVRSYRLPLVMFLDRFPAMSLLGLAGIARAVYTKASGAWLALLAAAALALFCFVSGFFGASLDSPRLIIVFYLLVAPFFGLAVASLPPAPARSLPAVALAAIASLGFLPPRLPRPLSGLAAVSPGTGVYAKAIYLVARERRENPNILFELYEGGPEAFAENPLQFAAFDRVLLDRRKLMPASTNVLVTENNPSVLRLPDADLRSYFRENRVGLIIVHTGSAVEKLNALAQPIESIEGVALYGFGLPPPDIDAYRERIREVRAAVARQEASDRRL